SKTSGKPARKGRANEVRIGMRLKHARLAKGYTLKQLAEIVDCSESMISKVENDKLRPSISMLHRYAQALETNIASLIAEPDPAIGHVSILRKDVRPRIHVDPELQGADVWLERVITPSKGGLLQAHVLNLAPGSRSDGLIHHVGEELGFVIAGDVHIEIDGKTYQLSEGDSAFFPSSLPHGYYNKGKKLARILWVNTPPSF
ncbi:MAG TPA: cupin domain-containing protein, partial [Terriglobales bacterium]|nr:cupin domain-containing protein [Terriglobales bacterium]